MKSVTRSKRRKGGAKSGPAFLAALLAAALLSAGCGKEETPAAARLARPTISGVSVAALAPVKVDEFYEAAGTVRAATTCAVASRLMGTVTSLPVREGDAVEKGQLLLTIDDRDMVQKVKAAEAGHQEALKALESAGQNRELTDITCRRYRTMYEQKAISRQEMDQFETQRQVALLEHERVRAMVNRAEAALSEARIMLGFSRVTSPLKGQVTEKRTEVGGMAVPGVPLLTVESTDSFQAHVAVDEKLSGKVRTGMPVTVSIGAIDRPYAGKIAEILPAVDPLSRSFTVKVSLTGPGLRSGLYAKIRMPLGKKEAILAPRAAVVEKGQLAGVYAVDDQGVATYRLIRTGRQYDSQVEILSGLRAGDRIIVQGAAGAVDGGIVRPKP